MKSLIITIFAFSIFSCISQESKSEYVLKKCVNKAVNKDIEAAYGQPPFDFYELMLDFEEMIINSTNKKRNKKYYEELLLSIISNTKNYNNLYYQLDEKSNSIGFGYNIFTICNSILAKCPYQVFFKNNNTSHPFIKDYLIKISQLESQGYVDKKLIEELFEIIDEHSFSKIVYRAPIILLVMINLDNKYNEDLKKYKESIKGKSFLGQEQKRLF